MVNLTLNPDVNPAFSPRWFPAFRFFWILGMLFFCIPDTGVSKQISEHNQVNQMENTKNMETIKSKDGTLIAFKQTGSGPPLVLVHGSGAGDHTRWEINGVRSALAKHFTVYAVDRRGRGGSGDADVYSIEREYEDIAAVADAVDEPVILLGHSMGANLSLEASLLTDNISKLILYEPGILAPDHEYNTNNEVARINSLLDDGEDEKALELFLLDIAGLTPDEIEIFRADPSWQARVNAAHTLPREEIAFTRYRFDAALFKKMEVPTLLLTGSESPGLFKYSVSVVHDALPNSRISILDGQAHVAMNTAPELFIEKVLEFALKTAEN